MQIDIKHKKEDNEIPEFLKESTIFFGTRGSGKTTFKKIVQEYHKHDYFRFLKAQQSRKENNLTPFPEEHCCFANIPDASNYFGGANKKSYAFDPFKFMIPNETYKHEQISEYGVYDITEGQKYYDSYKYQDIPDFVTYAIENLRAMNVILNIDVQRGIRIAPSIREIYTSFVRPVDIFQDIDNCTGKVIRTILYYLWFPSWQEVELFLKEYGENETKMRSHPHLKKYVVDYNVFDCFDSWENKKIFYQINKSEPLNKPYGAITTFKEIQNNIAFWQIKFEKIKEQENGKNGKI